MPGLDAKQVADFHKRMFVGKNMIVAVAGDFDPETATKALAAAFSSVPAGEAYQWKQAPMSRRSALGSLLSTSLMRHRRSF